MEATALTNETLFAKAKVLAIFTIVYNLAEGIISVLFGFEDESLTLFGFGVDSFIESISAIGIFVMITRIRNHPTSQRANFERTALKITGAGFYVLTFGLILTAIYLMLKQHTPDNSVWGILISCISISVMWLLIRTKTDVGMRLHSEAILADARCGKICLYMSLVLLASSGLYHLTGFKYADVIGAVGLSWFAYREGGECFDKADSEKHCGCE